MKTGGYIQAGAELGTIDKLDSLSVTSSFTLTPRDYERINSGAIVDLQLPNAKVLEGRVRKVNVVTNDQGQAKTTVEVVSNALKSGGDDGLSAPGTPIEATLHLRDDGVLAGVADGFQGFIRQIGL